MHVVNCKVTCKVTSVTYPKHTNLVLGVHRKCVSSLWRSGSLLQNEGDGRFIYIVESSSSNLKNELLIFSAFKQQTKKCWNRAALYGDLKSNKM